MVEEEEFAWVSRQSKNRGVDAAGILPEALQFGSQDDFQFGEGIKHPVAVQRRPHIFKDLKSQISNLKWRSCRLLPGVFRAEGQFARGERAGFQILAELLVFKHHLVVRQVAVDKDKPVLSQILGRYVRLIFN